MPSAVGLSVLEGRRTLLARLSALRAPDEVLAFVRQDTYSLSYKLGPDGGRKTEDGALGLVLFLEETETRAEDRNLAIRYAGGALKLAAGNQQRQKRLSRLPENARASFIRNLEERTLLPESADGVIRTWGPDGAPIPPGVADSREPTDGPDRHYLRDYRIEVDAFGISGVVSLPCAACREKGAGDPCSPKCSVPGGLCSGLWYRPTGPGVLGPHWRAAQAGWRAIRHDVSAVYGKRGEEKAREAGKQTGRPKAPAEDAVAEVVQLIVEIGEPRTRTVLVEDRQYSTDETDRLVRSALRKLGQP